MYIPSSGGRTQRRSARLMARQGGTGEGARSTQRRASFSALASLGSNQPELVPPVRGPRAGGTTIPVRTLHTTNLKEFFLPEGLCCFVLR